MISKALYRVQLEIHGAYITYYANEETPEYAISKAFKMARKNNEGITVRFVSCDIMDGRLI
jgi:hypothetical protein